MNINWKLILGLALVSAALIVAPLIWQFFMPYGGYGMMQSYAYRMPMMNGFGMMNPFGMWLMSLIPLGAFVLIGFAVGWAANQFTRRSS